MNCNVPVAQATMEEAVLPQRVQEALGPLVGHEELLGLLGGHIQVYSWSTLGLPLIDAFRRTRTPLRRLHNHSAADEREPVHGSLRPR